jgi:hypothetical protein
MRLYDSLNPKGSLVTLSLPNPFLRVISIFVPVFSQPIWPPVKVLITGAILAPGTRTVACALRLMGHKKKETTLKSIHLTKTNLRAEMVQTAL